MFHLPLLYELSPLYLAQAALTVWMLVDAQRRGVEYYWFWLILAFQPLGAWAYFFAYKLPDFTRGRSASGGPSWLAKLFTRRPSLEALRFRVEQSPTPLARLELAERLVETHQYEEAVPHLKSVLAREPEHLTALFTLATCHREAGRHQDAVPLLQKVIAVQPHWRGALAWMTLIDTCQRAGDHPEAVARARELSRIAPSLEHTCLLARCLVAAGDSAAARHALSLALEEYRFTPSPSRHDRRWVGKAGRLLADVEQGRA